MTREEQICNNIGLVHACAGRFRDRGLEYDDLFQAGCLGLTKAVDGFEVERGLQFSTYAVPVILGEMRRLFREGGTVKVSRTLKERALKINRERARLALALDREPSVSELACAVGCTAEEVAESMRATMPPLSLTREREDDEGGVIDVPIPSAEETLTNRLALKQVLSELPPRDRELIILRYMRRQTQQATADMLGMTQVQVSRREKKILAQMKEKLTV